MGYSLVRVLGSMASVSELVVAVVIACLPSLINICQTSPYAN